MTFLNVFKQFYNNKNIVKFIYNINKLDRGKKNINNEFNKLSSLISFNFYKKKIYSFKIYCEVFRQFFPNEILKFLPTDKDFNYYLNFWDNSIHSSLCFGIKLDRKYNPINYFHIKFGKYSSELNEFKKLNIFKEITYKNHKLGISYEYRSINNFVKKYYVYFYNKLEIMYLLKKYSLEEDVSIIDHIEYTEFNNNDKIIVVYKLDNFKTPYLTKKQLYKSGNKIIKNCIDFFNNEFGILPVYFGKYKNHTLGLYWSLTNNILNKPYIMLHIKN